MTVWHAAVLGIVQGLTEFFPISSSGHLVILQSAFGIAEPQIAFDVFLHFGTLIAIIVYFWRDILRLFTSERRVLGCLVIGSVPAALVGFFLREGIESLFASPRLVGVMLVVTGLWLFGATYAVSRGEPRGKTRAIGPVHAILVGLAQAAAIVPGISRSGSTIGAGLMAGLDKGTSFRFAFLLAIPAIGGATLLKARKIGAAFVNGEALIYAVGGCCALAAGLASIALLRAVVRGNKLYLFGIYCIIIGSMVIFFF